MNNLLKFSQTEERKVFCTSDFHAFHQQPFVWKSRGFNSPEEHTKFIIEVVNATVRSTDILFFLGDMVLNCKKEEFEWFISQLNCRQIYVIWGNHNSCIWPIYKREVYNTSIYDVEIYPFKYKNLIFLGNYAEISVDNQFIVLSHYPLLSWNSMQRGSWHCFGHIHSTPENITFKGKCMDVGFDYHNKPISFYELKKTMDAKEIVHEGHH